MKNKPKHFRNINSKNVIISAVALVLLLVISVFAVSSWVETISTIIIQGDLAIDSPVYTDASIKTDSKDSIDLAKYFREAGNVHLSEASSADGINFYFPILDSTNYRQNNINDINVNYINFKLKVKSDADKSFVFNQEPTIKIGGNKISNSAVRVAISLDGITQIFSLAESTESVVASKSGSPLQPTNVLKFSDFLSQNANNNKVFSLSKNSEKELTISIWLQQGIAGDVSGKEIAIENLSLVPDVPRYRIQATAVTDGTANDSTGGTVKVGNANAAEYSSENIEQGEKVTLTAAISSDKYMFIGWYDAPTGGNKKSDSAAYSFTSTSDCHYYARFAKGCQVVLYNELLDVDSNKVTVNTSCGSVQAGNATAANNSQTTVANGSSIELKAKALNNYKFMGWYEQPSSGVPGKLISSENPYVIEKVTSDMRLHARFAPSFTYNVYALTNDVQGSSGGTVKLNDNENAASSTLEVIKKETVTAVATPNSSQGYKFVGWFDDTGNKLSDKETYEFTATSDTAKDIYAKFYSTYEITVYAQYNNSTDSIPEGLTVIINTGTQGATSVAKSVLHGSTINMEAFIDDDSKYKFDGWYDVDGNPLDDNASTSFNYFVNGDKDVYAKFSDVAEYIYLDPGAWNVDSAWFAAYFFGDGDEWAKMEKDDATGYYKVAIPDSKYTKVIFCRMKSGDTSTLDWSNKWNQTVDITLPKADANVDDNKVLFKITEPWAGKNGQGAKGKWETLSGN